jgi:pilus assembly protein CpaB
MKLPAWMNTSVLMLVVAVVFGVAAFIGAQRYLSQTRAEVEDKWRKRYQSIEVVVAAAELPAGRVLRIEDLAKREMPEAFLPTGRVTADEIEPLLGQQLLIALSPGDALSVAYLSGHGGQALASRLQDGTRAVTVPVDEVSSQAGLVRPGDRVDLLLAEEQTVDTERCVSVKPLLESLVVLATGQHQVDPSRGADQMLRSPAESLMSYSTMTLDVTPAQAQQLALALRVGDLIPMLRGQSDTAPVDLVPRSNSGNNCKPKPLESTTAAVDKPKPKRVGHSIELMVGGSTEPKRSEHWFPAK